MCINRFLAPLLTHSLLFMILISASVFIPLTWGQVSADDYVITLLSEKMPLGLSCGSGAWDGKYAYVFGGWDNRHNSGVIVKYDPRNHLATALFDNLPSPRYGTAAVYANGTVYGAHNVCYIFGGFDVGSYDPSTQIVRFWPQDEWREILYWNISGRGHMSAIWNGRAAYLFGGIKAPDESNPSVYLDEILKFEPVTSAETVPVEILPVKLPHVRAHTSAVWDGKNAYIFGGWYINVTRVEFLDDILKFNPATNELTTMQARLPTARAYTSAIWDGSNAYIFGGQTRLINESEITLDEIVRYNPSTDEVSILPQRLPSPRHATVAVWNGSAAYIFGGRDGIGTDAQIVMMSHESQVSRLPLSWLDLGPPLALILVGVILPSLYAVKKYRDKSKKSPEASPSKPSVIPQTK